MIKSKKFWIGTILLAVIPLLLIDIAKHTVDWNKEVKEEIINIAYHPEQFTGEGKSEALEVAFDKNERLQFRLYMKSFLGIALLILSSYFLIQHFRENRRRIPVSVFSITGVITCFLCIRVLVLPHFILNNNIRFLKLEKNANSFQKLYNTNFKGKVVYVDFWGTTCGPCLDEFRHSTQPLKKKYNPKNISFLYICGGNAIRHEFMWREQIKKYNIEGYHVFLDWDQYDNLYRQLVNNKNIAVTMPRYLILDKTGTVVNKDAKRPSDQDSLYTQLNRYLQ